LSRAQAAAQQASPAAASSNDDPATTKFFDAAMLGNLPDVRAAIAAHVPIEATNGAHLTPLGVAALYGHADVVSALVAAGANVNADQDGQTPLMLAAQAGHTAVV